jgi:hypothetical protein
MLKVEKLLPFDRLESDEGEDYINPMVQDMFHMGAYIGKNVCVLYHSHEDNRYVIVVNRKTGERCKVWFEDPGKPAIDDAYPGPGISQGGI